MGVGEQKNEVGRGVLKVHLGGTGEPLEVLGEYGQKAGRMGKTTVVLVCLGRPHGVF